MGSKEDMYQRKPAIFGRGLAGEGSEFLAGRGGDPYRSVLITTPIENMRWDFFGQ